MSGNSARSVGRLAFTAVGYYVGGLYGQPALGGAIGGAVGGALFPHQLPDAYGPRLEDLSIQTSAVGVAVPLVYGTYPVAGNVMWAAPIREVSETEEVGKGSGTEQDVTTYSYFGSFAIGLCEGEIAGITRIWANESLVYDIRPQQSGETDAAFNQRMAGSTAWAEYMTVYLGSETQEADPTIEAEEGAGNVPGYRGLAYIVFDGLPLGDFYNRFPQLKVEVVSVGDINGPTYEYANEVLYPWVEEPDPRDLRNTHEIHKFGSAARYGTIFESEADALESLAAEWNTYQPDGPQLSGSALRLIGHWEFNGYTVPTDVYMFPAVAVDLEEKSNVVIRYSEIQPQLFSSDPYEFTDPDDPDSLDIVKHFVNNGIDASVGMYLNYPYFVSQNEVCYAASYSGASGWPTDRSLPTESRAFGNEFAGQEIFQVESFDVAVRRAPSPPQDPCSAADAVSTGTGYCVIDGDLHMAGDWQRDESTTYRALAKYETYGAEPFDKVVYPRNPIIPMGHSDFDNETFWAEAYQAAVLAGEMPAGLTFDPSGAGSRFTYPRNQTFSYVRELGETLTPVAVSVGGVLADLCARAGLVDVDTTALADDYIQGYAIGTVMAARDAIQPLRQYAQFDAAEVDGELRCVKRGGAAVAALTADDLGAYTGDQRPDPIAVERAQDVELPRRLRLHYASTDRDYEAGEQTASRLTTGAVNVHDIELPIAMSDTQAAQITEILLFDLWTARNGYRTTLATEHLALAPGDPITLPVDGQQERARILSIDYAALGLLTLELARDDDGNYVSYAVGNAGSFRPGVVTVSGPTEVVLLDLPALLDADNNPGYYAAMRGLLDGWQGASLFRSNDGGGSYTAVASASNAATMGAAAATLPDALTTIWDRGNALSVLLDSGEMEGITESAVLAGGNAAALEVRDGDGATLGWEVLQFAEAVQEPDGSWTLTDLLRGRKGTEWATGLHQAGDRFVLLTGPGIIRIPMESSGIGIERPHRAVTVGTGVDSASIVEFAGNGAALEPYSPVQVRGDWDGADLVLSWIRRGRIGNAYSSGTDIPLSEETEAYEVDILSSSTVLRTLAGTSQSVTYTAAQQAADWGSPVPDTFTVRVYQLSATVGRGYPAEATV